MEAIECLKDIFQNVNNWINFAEAKNAALVGFDIAILAVYDKLWETMPIYVEVGYFLFLFSMICPLLSFFPFYKCIRFKKKKKHENLLFFRNIAAYDDRAYFEALSKTYLKECDIKGKENLLLDYVQEIVVNSRISVYKLLMFKIGLCVSIFFIAYMVLLNFVYFRVISTVS